MGMRFSRPHARRASQPDSTRRVGWPTRTRPLGGRVPQRGQTLVEFAMVFPIFMFLFLAIIEFGLVFNALLSINFATRDASLIAAEAGNSAQADCVILKKVQDSIGAPASAARVTEIRIYKANKNGTSSGAENVYVPGGPMACKDLQGAAFTVPYSKSGTLGYPATDRCNILAGCAPAVPGSTEVDTIGVRVSYDYEWATPIGNLLNFAFAKYDMVSSNIMRMEPVL